MNNLKMIHSIVNLAVNIIVWLLLLRFLLKLFGANAQAFFVTWIYTFTEPLLLPFKDMFNTSQIGNGSILELATLFAIVIYIIFGYFLRWLIKIIDEHTSEDTSANK